MCSLLEDQLSNRPTILLVDDNPLILGAVRALLEHEQMQVYACQSGQEGLEILNAKKVDLVICDVMMPEITGYQFQQMVRERSDLVNVPFVFLTGLNSADDKIKAKAAGVDDYLTKPFDPKELIAMVHGKIDRARAQRAQTETRYEQYRRQVLHTLSHEFRTPLVAINTGAEILLDQPQLEETKLKTLVEAIQRGGLRLERLVNDFMTLQQIDTGLAKRLAESRKASVSIEELADRIVGQVKEGVVSEGSSLLVERSVLPHYVEVFEAQILDAVARLVQNGCKFSKSPKQITLQFLTQGDEFVIQVLDNGIGFQERQLGAMTQAFSQIDRQKLEQQGSGAGLAIVAAYVGFAGGQLTFANRPEGGAKVSIILPTVGS